MVIEQYHGEFDDSDQERERRAQERRELRAEISDRPNPVLYARLAGLYLRDGRGPDAAHVCEEGIARFPEHGELYAIIGELLLEAKQSHLARRNLLLAVRFDEFNYHALSLLGEAELVLGYFRGAAATARKILAFLPGDGRGRELLRRAEEHLGL